ncbi:class I SAM-dependent methyltransferase [Candidatus Uabimicrobium amorphum]|uniref:Methyltransferase domain-containing protein n=1 Tax=Uabimicrobium amorphum TaxID=2596890 RepID=A0A5S9F464_UABAM|nr:class I SAM-dependent methyltransferase [Candidatus Uabimicrobium amorphum]BBM85477.1 hypothetical protein UABAM_03846 [Candidatus Uabimicrobium amorphum]
MLEVSDVIIDYDPGSLKRKPVKREDAFAKVSGFWPRNIIKKIPHNDGVLNHEAVDKILFNAHCEMQRLWEEFLHGERISVVLRTFIDTLREQKIAPPYRIVDVGCGLGYNIRWLAANNVLDSDVQLVGVDYNDSLIHHAKAIRDIENLSCEFIVGNAFALEEPATVFMSTGVIHHFAAQHLQDFFYKQQQRQPLAFFHFDIQPSWLAPIGSWLFHMARMRSALARYDGYLSARRAHHIEVLAQTARQGAPNYNLIHYGCKIPLLPVIRNMHAIIGIDPCVSEAFLQKLPNPRNLWKKL